MSKENFKVLLLVTLSAIADMGEEGLPSGHLYATMMSRCDLNTYNIIIETLAGSKWITHTNNYITITPRGKEMGDKVSAAIKAA
jgi:hypothetical protein